MVQSTATVAPCPCCDLGGLDHVPCPSRIVIDEGLAIIGDLRSKLVAALLVSRSVGWRCLACAGGATLNDEGITTCRKCGVAKPENGRTA